MDPIFEYLEIDTCDIWQHEFTLFQNDHCSLDHAQMVMDKIRPIIIEKATPIIKAEDQVGDPDSEKYWSKKVDRFFLATRSLKELYSLGYFIGRDGLYQYDYNILVEQSHIEFDFWFTLKLRQYDNKLSATPDFLEYQLQKNFDGNASKYLLFLKLITRQHSDLLISKKLALTISEWEPSNSSSKENIKGQRRNTKEARKSTAASQSFLLKAFEQDKNYFQNHSQKVVEIFIDLKSGNEPFIDPKTTLDQFKSIFQNKTIHEKNRIIWTGTNKELQRFVKILHYDLKKIAVLKNDIWVTTSKCFVKRDGKEFHETQLKDAKGNRQDRFDLLKKLLSEL